MPAFRGINLRSGDIAEQLGVLLLKTVALVATVPRTEDVGIDVVATLIRKFDSYRYLAEDSFFVQIKSASITEVVFKKAEVKWLCNLQLPFFIASVDRKSSAIRLYNTCSLSDALVENPQRDEVRFQLWKNYEGDCSNDGPSIDIPIGPAIIEWSIDTVHENEDFLEHFHNVMKSHVLHAKKSIETRRVGFAELATWQTGKPPVVYGSKLKPVEDFTAVDEITAPYLSVLLQKFMFADDLLTVRSLYRLLEKILEMKGHFEVVNSQRQLIPWTAPSFDRNK